MVDYIINSYQKEKYKIHKAICSGVHWDFSFYVLIRKGKCFRKETPRTPWVNSFGRNGLLRWDTSPPNVGMRLVKLSQGALLLLGYRGNDSDKSCSRFSGNGGLRRRNRLPCEIVNGIRVKQTSSLRCLRICFVWGTSTECGLYVLLCSSVLF